MSTFCISVFHLSDGRRQALGGAKYTAEPTLLCNFSLIPLAGFKIVCIFATAMCRIKLCRENKERKAVLEYTT